MMQELEEMSDDGMVTTGFALTASESALSAKTHQWMSFPVHEDDRSLHVLCDDCGNNVFHRLRVGNPRQPQRCGLCGENITGDEHVRVTSVELVAPVTAQDGSLALEAEEEIIGRDESPDGYMCVDCALLIVGADEIADMFAVKK